MDEARAAVLELVARRGPDKTVCPSEVAKALTGPDGDWREQMASVHRAVDALVEEGRVELSWKRARLPRRSGPYRIAVPSRNVSE